MLIFYQTRIGNSSPEKQNLDHLMRHLPQITKEKTKVTMTGEPSSKIIKRWGVKRAHSTTSVPRQNTLIAILLDWLIGYDIHHRRNYKPPFWNWSTLVARILWINCHVIAILKSRENTRSNRAALIPWGRPFEMGEDAGRGVMRWFVANWGMEFMTSIRSICITGAWRLFAGAYP
jgi:hypothetical protein